jgi:hypothetical protein
MGAFALVKCRNMRATADASRLPGRPFAWRELLRRTILR